MSESTVTLLNNPYGKVSFDSFRLKNRAFVDKSNWSIEGVLLTCSYFE